MSAPKNPKKMRRGPIGPAQKEHIAAGVLLRKTKQEIADELGTDRPTVSRLANGPEIQQRISELVLEHRGKIRGLIELSLQRVEEMLNATKGNEPDQWARNEGVKRALDLANMAHDHEVATGAGDETRGRFPMADALVVYREILMAKRTRES